MAYSVGVTFLRYMVSDKYSSCLRTLMLTIAGRAKRVSQISEKVATGILSGVVKVTGYFTSSLANSKAGKKFFNLLPGEIVLASLDGFGTCCY